MQRHAIAAAHVLLVVSAFGASVIPGVAQTTTRLEREVREELRGERDLRRLDVTVAGMEVTLTGEVETFWSKSEAIRRALEVEGVETVVSEIEIPPAESDEKLAAEVVKAMQRYPYYTLFDYLDGRINGGVVTLMGKVTAERDKAGELFERVAKVPGVQADAVRSGIIDFSTVSITTRAIWMISCLSGSRPVHSKSATHQYLAFIGLYVITVTSRQMSTANQSVHQ